MIVKFIKILSSIVLLVVLSSCTQLFFQPQKLQYSTPDRVGVIYNDLEIEVDEGNKLHGWKLFAKTERRGTILFFHGNAENISTHFLNVHWLTDYGYDVYLFDYRGYGKSEGIAQLDAVIADAQNMFDYTFGQLDKGEKLIVMGHSLGGSLAIHAVAHSEFKNRIHALITVEAFSDYHEIAQDVVSTSWLAWLLQWPVVFVIDNTYRPLNAVNQLAPVSLLLMHSKQDDVIPFNHAEVLYEAAEEPKKLQVVSGNHGDIFNQQKNRELLLQYLNESSGGLRF